MVHLNRFIYGDDGEIRKNESVIGTPTNLEVDGIKYRLSAVVKHSGSRRSGHYMANIRTENGWLELDDHCVKKITVAKMYWSPYVYLLFYEALSVPDTSFSEGPRRILMSRGVGAETRCGSS